MNDPKLDTAIKAARLAGNHIQRAARDLNRVQISKKQHNDYVTNVDQEAEQIILNCIKQTFPLHSFLCEESGLSQSRSDYCWIIDPLDGTCNFIHGIPHYCISIALYHNEKPEIGVIYDPNRNELYRAAKGRGAFLDDHRLRIDPDVELKNAIVACCFSSRKNHVEEEVDLHLQYVKKVARSCLSIRHISAAALDLAYIAAGRYDALFAQGLQPWDCAAGMLIVQEAGGYVGNFLGNETNIKNKEVLAGRIKTFAQLVPIIKKRSKFNDSNILRL